LRGRYIDERDRTDSEPVVLIDRRLADKYWPSENPIGQKIHGDLKLEPGDPVYTIVGVVGEVLLSDLTAASPVGVIYLSNRQRTRRDLALAVKTDRGGEELSGAIASVIQRLDPELPFYDVRSMNQRLEDSLESRKAIVWLSSLFGGLALFLSGIGIYGVLAYSVSQRKREFGIRMALGAESGAVVRSVAGQGLRLAVVGLLVGICAAFVLTRLMGSLLYDVVPRDPMVFAAVSAILTAVALVASMIPSLRATRIDPNKALREE
jgi:ABC-type antimicrobial peptide transport system permease subunit